GYVMSPPKAAIFDIFGTVVDWRSGIIAEAKRIFAQKGVNTDLGRFADAWRSEYAPSMAPISSGERPYVKLETLHMENLRRVLAAMVPDVAFSEDELETLNSAWTKLPPWQDSVSGLRAMRSRMMIATCSNGSIALMTRLARYGGLPWDCILGAEIAQSYKPAPIVYHASCEALGLRPDEVVMVACHNSDLAAARKAGLRTGYIPRPEEHGPNGTHDDAQPSSDWDYIGVNLIDLGGRIAAG
ncbi:MAG: haloacid dehalogenase type II, partial [Pikeienuella sp.]